MQKLTKRLLIDAMDGLPDEAPIYYHGYYKGLCLSNYVQPDIWRFPKPGGPKMPYEQKAALVINPGSDWDHRQARAIEDGRGNTSISAPYIVAGHNDSPPMILDASGQCIAKTFGPDAIKLAGLIAESLSFRP